jgi:hypothetical protein
VKLLSFTLIFILIVSCNKSFQQSETITATNFSNYQIECKVTTYEKNETNGINKALKKAFERLFFIGFPNTISSTPLITNNLYGVKNDALLEDFVNNNKYSPFITSINNQSRTSKVDKKNYKVSNTTIVIDIPSLRRYLENTGQTRRFGY